MGMLTLDEVLAHQKDMAHLCADRPLTTREIFAPNAFYGFDAIFKEYAGLPQTYALKAILPHGVLFNEKQIWEAEKNVRLPAIFCYPPYKDAYQTQTNKKVILSAAPFLYVKKMAASQPQPPRRGTIVFPHHSTHLLRAQFNSEQLIETLLQFGDEYQPITVCIYWQDFLLNRHLPYQQRGMQIVSAGHIYDPDFLYRLYHLCSLHRYAVGHSFGSHLFHAVAAGCSYSHLDYIDYVSTPLNQIHPEDQAIEIASEKADRLKALFHQRRPTMTSEQIAVVNDYLGQKYFQTPQNLYRQIVYTEIIDKLGCFTYQHGKISGLRYPTWLRRNIAQIIRKFHMKKDTK